MFVAFADAQRAHTTSERAVVFPERGLFGVAAGPLRDLDVLVSALDAGTRTSNSADDIAEVIDGVDAELRERYGPVAEHPHGRRVDETLGVSLALALAEVDALAFFHVGAARAVLWNEPALAMHAIMRNVARPNDARLGLASGPIRFARMYASRGAVATLFTAGCFSRRDDSQLRACLRPRDLAATAQRLVEAGKARTEDEPATAVVIRVDEEPRIR